MAKTLRSAKGLRHLDFWDGFPFRDRLKDLDLSCKMNLDVLDCFGRENTHFVAELYKMQLHICGNFREDKIPSYN